MRTILLTVAWTALLLLLLAVVVSGAEPTVVPQEVLEGGDFRSEGTGPGLVGNPVLILLAVVGLGLVTAGLTVLLVRLTDRGRR